MEGMWVGMTSLCLHVLAFFFLGGGSGGRTVLYIMTSWPADETSSMNPLTMIANTYNEDDLIIVKLDIDTPSIELLDNC